MGQLHPTARGKRTVRQDVFIDGPTWESIDYDDIDQVRAATTQAIRQNYLRTARMHVLRDAISICYMQYSVNHQAKCRPLYIEYCRQLELLGHVKVNIPELHPTAATEGGEGEKEGKGHEQAEE